MKTKELIEDLKHYFSDVPLVMEAVEALEDKQETIDGFLKAKEMKDNHPLVKKFLSDWRKREGKNDLYYPDTYTIYEDYFSLKKEIERVKKERDKLARKTEDPCTLCRHYTPCSGRSCPSFCEGVGDAEGKYPDWHWSCEDFQYGSCPVLENTPCFECIQNGYKGFEWREKEKTK